MEVNCSPRSYLRGPQNGRSLRGGAAGKAVRGAGAEKAADSEKMRRFIYYFTFMDIVMDLFGSLRVLSRVTKLSYTLLLHTRLITLYKRSTAALLREHISAARYKKDFIKCVCLRHFSRL